MIGLVLVTHGRLAHEFRLAVEHVVGPQDAFETISIGPEDDMEQRRTDIVEAVARADRGHGVIIVTDMFGGTPSNLAISVMDGVQIDVLAGMNLPMLIKLASVRQDQVIGDALRSAQEAGRKYINVASRILSGK
jgi:PTS system mannose-specific IIA component